MSLQQEVANLVNAHENGDRFVPVTNLMRAEGEDVVQKGNILTYLRRVCGANSTLYLLARAGTAITVHSAGIERTFAFARLLFDESRMAADAPTWTASSIQMRIDGLDLSSAKRATLPHGGRRLQRTAIVPAFEVKNNYDKIHEFAGEHGLEN